MAPPDAAPPPPPPRSAAAARVAIAYAALGALWIVASDALLAAVASDASVISVISLFKGWLFVGATAVAVFLVLRRWRPVGELTAAPSAARNRRWAVVSLVAGAITLGTGGAAVLKVRADHDAQAIDQLRAVSRLEAQLTQVWLDEARRNATFLATSPVLSDALAARLRGDAPAADAHFERFAARAKVYGVAEVRVYESGGRLVFGPPPHALAPERLLEALKSVIATGHAALLDDHIVEPTTHGPHIDLFAPIAHGGEPRPAHVLSVASLPSETLWPLLATWPLPTTSGKTLLVQRRGDTLVLLNRVVGPAGARQSVALPASRVSEVGIRLDGDGLVVDEAVAGRTADGRDVISLATPVAHTSWFAVAKIDEAELHARLTHQLFWAVASAGLFVLLVVFGLLLLRQQGALREATRRRVLQSERLEMLEALERSREEREALATHLASVTEHARDVFLLVAPDLRIVEVNKAAEQAYGYTREQLLAMSIRDLRNPRHEASLREHWARSANPEGLLFETEHLRADGSVVPVEVSVRGIDIGGKTYRQSFVRDISARREAERLLRESEERFRNVARATNDVLWDWDVRSGAVWRSTSPKTTDLGLEIGEGEEERLIHSRAPGARGDHSAVAARARQGRRSPRA